MVDTATAALVAAIISGAITLWNGRKTNANSVDIARMKGVVDSDLARLNAKLSHGQLINSTQWNAEFATYQAIWKKMVPVRTTAVKLVRRESDHPCVEVCVARVSHSPICAVGVSIMEFAR